MLSWRRIGGTDRSAVDCFSVPRHKPEEKHDAQAYYRGGEVAGGQLLARALRNGATRLRPAWPPGGVFRRLDQGAGGPESASTPRGQATVQELCRMRGGARSEAQTMHGRGRGFGGRCRRYGGGGGQRRCGAADGSERRRVRGGEGGPRSPS